MRGHIRKRGNSYAVVVDIGRDPLTQKRRQKWHSGYRTRKEAQSALTEILTRLDQGTYVLPSKQTVSEFLGEWLGSVESRLRPSTFASYKIVTEKHLVPRVGSLPLQTLNAAHLNALYAQLLASGRRVGEGGLSPSTVRYVHAVIRKALGDAVRWNLVARNVADAADPPRPKRAQMKTWSAEEMRTFLDSVKADPLYAAYALAATTGMRRGEVLGLTWKNLDLEGARISITQALTVVGGYEIQFSEPKTANGRRMVALDPQTVSALREHRAAQIVDRSLMGQAYQDQNLVFARGDGTPVHPRAFSSAFASHVERADVPRIRLHDLRHTHATLALEAGIHPKVVSERLGHASVTITLDTYSHALPAMQEAAASLVASLVFEA